MLDSNQRQFLKSLLTRARMRTGITKMSRTSHTVFYDEQRSGAAPDERDPATLSLVMDRFIINRGWDLQVATSKLKAQWPAIVGQDVSAHVAIESFELHSSGRTGALVLRADSTAWATQMRFLLPTLRETLAEILGAGQVTEITILGPVAPSWNHGQRRVKGRGPRDTYG